MAIKIKFDSSNIPQKPTIVLMNRSGHKLGYIPTSEEVVKCSLNAANELSFSVYKGYDDVAVDAIWDDLVDFKLVWCREWNQVFEIYVETEDGDNGLVKHITATSLGEAELSQINLYDIQINTTDDLDIAPTDSNGNPIPTVLYDEDNPEVSLLDRITEKAPHYSIAHVDSSIKDKQRVFTFDDTSIYDAFMDIADEIDCLFQIDCKFNSDGDLVRTISVYDLESYCYDCGYRGEFTKVCPECNSTNITEGYGNDTTIFVSTENLTDDITFETDNGAVKNCFKLIGGDDLMTAAIRSCNPNGSDYIWYISDETKSDMSDELVSGLESYDALYQEYQKTKTLTVAAAEVVTQYNNYVEYYNSLMNADYEKISTTVVGFPNLITAYYNAIDFDNYLNTSLMPTVLITHSTAKAEAAKITSSEMGSIGVPNIDSVSETTAENAVKNMAATLVGSNRYYTDSAGNKTFIAEQYSITITTYSFSSNYSLCAKTGTFQLNTIYYVKSNTSSTGYKKLSAGSDYNNGASIGTYDGDVYTKSCLWNGYLTLSSNYDDDDPDAQTDTMTLTITGDYKTYVNQRISKTLTKSLDENAPDIVYLFKLDLTSFTNQLKKYSLTRLNQFLNCCQSCLDILIEQGIADDETWAAVGTDNDLYTQLYLGYYNKYNAIVSEIALRETQLSIVESVLTSTSNTVIEVQDALNFENYLGETLWLEFAAYRREDSYQNDNFISDGLTNAEIIENAIEFTEEATKELYKSATLQHSISSTLDNLLVIPEFKPIVDYFELGNWLRARIDDNIYKLRLIQYEVNFDNIEQISVQFSDVTYWDNGLSDLSSILDQASSMATSYGSVTRQAKKGENSNSQLYDWVNKGLALTLMKIVTDADDQNIELDEHGLLARQYSAITDSYDDKQLKLINKGIYLTDDAWKTAKVGVGNFVFWNPHSQQTEEGYGVIADTLVGDLILGEELGIYTVDNAVTIDNNGITVIANTTEEENKQHITIKKKYANDDGSISYDTIFDVDSEGNLILSSGTKVGTGSSSSFIVTPEQFTSIIKGVYETTMSLASGTYQQGVTYYKKNSGVTYSPISGTYYRNVTYYKYDSKSGYTLLVAGTDYQVGDTIGDNIYIGIESGFVKLIAGTDYQIGDTIGSGVYIETALSSSSSMIQQTNEKIALVVEDGSTSTSFTLTPGALNAIANDINLKGRVTFTGIDNDLQTTISGSVKADTLHYLVTSESDINKITHNTEGWTTDSTKAVMTEDKRYLYEYHEYTTYTVTEGKATPVTSKSSIYLAGVYGNDGGEAYTVVLSNESHTFAADDNAATGNQEAVTQIFVYRGSAQITDFTIGDITTPSEYLTCTKSGSTLTFKVTESEKIKEGGTVDIPITVEGESFTKVFSYSLAFSGVDGEPATVYSVVASPLVVKKDTTGVDPDSVNFSFYQNTGSDGTATFSGYYKIYKSTDNSKWTSVSSGSGKFVDVDIDTTNLFYRCDLYESEPTAESVVADSQTVTVVSDGTNGVNSYTYIRYSTEPDGSNFVETPTSETLYIGMYTGESPTAPTDKSDYTWSKYAGVNGNGIRSITYFYAVTKTQTQPDPKDITLDTLPSLSNENKYLWQKEIIDYTDETDKTTVILLAVYGDTGIDGTSVEITSTAVEYQASNSGESAPTGVWSNIVPALDYGQYLWTRTTVNYSDGNNTLAYSVSYKGSNGINTYTVSIKASSQVFKSTDTSIVMPEATSATIDEAKKYLGV